LFNVAGFFAAHVHPSTTPKKRKRTKGNITNDEFEHKMPMIDPKKKTFCNVFAHLKKMMKKVTSQALLLLKTMGVFI
jgi:hypothetical protein